MSELHRDGHGEKRNGKRPLRLEPSVKGAHMADLNLAKAELAHLSKYGVEIKDYAAHIFRDVLIFRRRPPPALASVRPGDKEFWQLIGVVSGMSPEAAAEFKKDLEAIPEPTGSEGPKA